MSEEVKVEKTERPAFKRRPIRRRSKFVSSAKITTRKSITRMLQLLRSLSQREARLFLEELQETVLSIREL